MDNCQSHILYAKPQVTMQSPNLDDWRLPYIGLRSPWQPSLSLAGLVLTIQFQWLSILSIYVCTYKTASLVLLEMPF